MNDSAGKQRPYHPSGKPIRQPKYGVTSRYRIPDDGAITPRLREKAGAHAIGFMARICTDDGDE